MSESDRRFDFHLRWVSYVLILAELLTVFALSSKVVYGDRPGSVTDLLSDSAVNGALQWIGLLGLGLAIQQILKTRGALQGAELATERMRRRYAVEFISHTTAILSLLENQGLVMNNETASGLLDAAIDCTDVLRDRLDASFAESYEGYGSVLRRMRDPNSAPASVLLGANEITELQTIGALLKQRKNVHNLIEDGEITDDSGRRPL